MSKISFPSNNYALIFSIIISFLPRITICQTMEEENKTLKNVIVIIGDDHSKEVIGCYGNNIIKTPNIDNLAAEGIRFNNAFSNSPICSASRQSLLCGKYPQATGVTLLQTSFSDNQLTVAEHLKKYGFSTGYVGKMHFNNQLPHGFDYRINKNSWYTFLNNTEQPELPEEMDFRPTWRPFTDPAEIWLNADMLPAAVYDEFDCGTYYAKKVAEFIELNQDNPFCLWVGFHEPHSPFNFPIEYHNTIDPKTVPLPTGCDEDDQWIPEIFKHLNEDQRRGIIASYYTSVEYLDKNIGSILKKLDSLNLRDETLIIYIGDHGYLLNDHKRFEKHMMWEEAVGAPLIIRAGNMYTQAQQINGLVEFVDIVPTILNYLDIPEMDLLQGKSLRPLISKDKNEIREYAFSVYYPDNKAMIRNHQYKYIFSTGQNDLSLGYATGFGPAGVKHRLYDILNDKNETSDLTSNEQYSSVLQNMQDEMLRKFETTHPYAKHLPQGLNITQKLSWFLQAVENFSPCYDPPNYPNPIFQESFSYPEGPLLQSGNEGLNWLEKWTNVGNLSTNKVEIPDNNKAVILELLNDNTQIRINRKFNSPIINSENEYWFSFQMNTLNGSNADNVANIMFTSSDEKGNIDQRIAFGRLYGQAQLGAVSPSENKSWSTDIADIGSHTFLVRIITHCNQSYDSVFVWLDQHSESKPNNEQANLSFKTTAFKKGINGVMLKCEGAGINQVPHIVEFDEIKLTNSYESLIASHTYAQKELSPETIHFFPNPFCSSLSMNLCSESTSSYYLRISEIDGRLLYEQEIKSNNLSGRQHEIRISNAILEHLPEGLLILELLSADGLHSVKKMLIKQC